MDKNKGEKKDDSNILEKRVLEGINRVFHQALNCETEEELGRVCLSAAEDLTGSNFGFLGEVNPRERLDTIAISNPGWDECKIPDSQKTLYINDMEIRGIWSVPLRTGESIIVNDPKNHPESVGVPEDHPPLINFLGVPLKDVDKPYGVLALANKKGAYTESDRRAVESLSIIIVELFRKKRIEMELARKSNDILDLSTPIIQLWEGIILVPLIGTLDSERTKLFIDKFLEMIVKYGAQVALIDITGVPTIDTQTAQNIIEAIISAKLLGTKVVLTGVRPSIAQTMVHLGIDLNDVETKSSLIAGLRVAYKLLGLEIVRIDND
jgi:anti-anti-sigma regulatory factor